MGEFVVDRCDRIRSVARFGVGARHDCVVVALAKPPQTIPIKVVDA